MFRGEWRIIRRCTNPSWIGDHYYGGRASQCASAGESSRTSTLTWATGHRACPWIAFTPMETMSQATAVGLIKRHKSQTGGEPTQLETLLKKPEVKRDQDGRFERHGKTLAKTQKKTGLNKQPNNELMIGQGKPGPGRPKGSKNKMGMALREQILASLDHVGGVEYLSRLAIENSSAYASLLARVLPSTLSMPETNGGERRKVTFERVIVWPDGHREIEGVTPKQL